jgi:hypothetical protein
MVDRLNVGMYSLNDQLGGTVLLLNDGKVEHGILFQNYP